MNDTLILEALGDAFSQRGDSNRDYRLVVTRDCYDNYKEVFKLTDKQMDAMYVVSSYLPVLANT